jgi:hypothetical protein
MTDDTDRGPIPGPTVPGIRASGRKVNLSDNPGKITIFTLFILIPAFLFDFYLCGRIKRTEGQEKEGGKMDLKIFDR